MERRNLLLSATEAKRMARREYQDPPIRKRFCETVGEEVYFIRYRVRQTVLEGSRLVLKRVQKQHDLGLVSKVTLAEVKRAKAIVMAKVNGEAKDLQSHVTWAVFVKQFLSVYVERLAEPTKVTYTWRLDHYVNGVLGDMRMFEIKRRDLQGIIDGLEAGGIAWATRNSLRGTLGAAFKYAIEEGYLDRDDENPAAKLKAGGGPENQREVRIPSLEDVGRLLELCNPSITLLIETLYLTGMRISELAGLSVRDLDAEMPMTLSIKKRFCRGSMGKTKSAAGVRTMPLPPELHARLLTHVEGKGPEEPIFTYGPSGRRIVDRHVISHYLTPRMQLLGIKFPGFGFHTFRRMHATHMRDKLSLFDLKRQMGHTDIRTTQKYVVDDIGDRATAVASLPSLAAPAPAEPTARKSNLIAFRRPA